jgi:hypothetical protein
MIPIVIDSFRSILPRCDPDVAIVAHNNRHLLPLIHFVRPSDYVGNSVVNRLHQHLAVICLIQISCELVKEAMNSKRASVSQFPSLRSTNLGSDKQFANPPSRLFPAHRNIHSRTHANHATMLGERKRLLVGSKISFCSLQD